MSKLTDFLKNKELFNFLELSPGAGLDAVVEHRTGTLTQLMALTTSVVGEVAVCTDFDCMVYYSGANTLNNDRFIVATGNGLTDVELTLGFSAVAATGVATRPTAWENETVPGSGLTGTYGEPVLPLYKTEGIYLGGASHKCEYTANLVMANGTPGANVTAEFILYDSTSVKADAVIGSFNAPDFTGVVAGDGTCEIAMYIPTKLDYNVPAGFDRYNVEVTQDGANSLTISSASSTLRINHILGTVDRTAW